MKKITKNLWHKKSGVVLVNVLIILSVLLVLGLAIHALLTMGIKYSRQNKLSLKALNITEASVDKAVFSLNNTPTYNGEVNTSFEGGQFTIVISNDGDKKIIESTATFEGVQRKIRVRVEPHPETQSVAFNYAIQSGAGGFEINNNAVIDGTVYSNGSIVGQNRNSSRITGDGFAVNNISTLTVERRGDGTGGNAHYGGTLSNVTVQGTSYHDDPQTKSLPNVDINYWQQKAEEGGVINTNPYYPPNGASLGPKKIAGNFILNGGYTLTLTGTLWITGDLTLNNGSIINLSGAYGQYGGAVIVDGKVIVNNNVHVNDNDPLYGGTGKPLLVVSQSNSVDPTSPAVSIGNNVLAIVFLAQNGMIKISQNADIQAAAAYKILVEENAEIHYKEGLADTQFSCGPGGSWSIMPGSWERF